MAFDFPYDFAALTSITGAQLQAQFDVIRTQVNGNILGTDLSASADILPAQLRYDEQIRTLSLNYVAGGTALPGGNALVAVFPLETVTGDEPWVITDMQWVCPDLGGLAGTIRIQYGAYDAATGLWAGANVSATTSLTGPVAQEGAQGSLSFATGSSYTCAVAGTVKCLALESVATDATSCTAAHDGLTVILSLQRRLI